MFFKIVRDPSKGSKISNKARRKGIICHSHAKQNLKTLYKDLKEVYTASNNKEDIEDMNKALIATVGKRWYCDIISLVLTWLDVHNHQQKRWLYMFDDW